VLGPGPSPGFIRDEASVSYNAFTLSQNLHDQWGGFLPLYIKSFGDYKSPLFPYLLAGVFRVTGPSRHAALQTASAVVFFAILLLGLLAWRRTRSLFVVCGTVVVAALTPWLYELGRTAYETIIEPLTFVLVLLAVDWAYRSTRPARQRAIPVGLALGAVTYSYAAGRLVAPLLALCLLVFVFHDRSRRRWLYETWAVYAVTLIPIVVYSIVHTGALNARFNSTTYVRHGMSPATIFGDFFKNYATDANLEHWVTSGDPTPYIHVHGAAELYVATVVLAAVSVAVLARQHRADRFWWFIGAALLLSPLPGAITGERYYSLRLLPMPLLLIVLGIPALDLVRRRYRDWAVIALVAALVAGTTAQFWQWRHNYYFNFYGRAVLFEAQVPTLLTRGFAGRGVLYVNHDDVYAQTHALWYAVTHGVPRSRISILPEGGNPPRGALEFGRYTACEPSCTLLAHADTYWLARENR
jgi:hypothetical protein